jgi:hypothetical protein
MRLHALTMASFEAGDAEKAERIRKEAILSQIDRFPDLFKTAEER